MAENNQPASTPEKPRRHFQIRLTRNLVLNYEKPEGEAAERRYQRCRRLKNFYQRVKRKACQKPRFAVEIAALGVVALYTGFAAIQGWEMRQSVEQQIMGNRPVMYHNGVDWLEKPPAGSLPSTVKVKINWKNFGRSLAVTVIPAAHIFVRPSKEVPPIDPDCHDRKLPKTKRTDAVAPDASFGDEYKWGLAGSDHMDVDGIKSGEKTLYVSGCVYYWGIDRKKRYITDLCVKWSATEPQDFPTCDDPGRNYAH